MGRRIPRNLFYALLTLMLLLAFSACGPETPSEPADSPAENGTTGESSEPGGEDHEEAPPALPEDAPDTVSADLHLDPATAAMDDADSLLVSQYIYDRLVGVDADGNVVPALAESWTMSEDQLDIIFVLRPDGQFHDGTPITADIVMANFNRWFDPEHALRGDGAYEGWEHYFLGFKGDLNPDDTPVSSFDGIEKVDDRTVLVHLNRIVPDVLEILTQPFFSILDPDKLAEGDYGMSAEGVNGSGPYQIGDWSDTALTLSPFDSYWGTPPAESIEFGLE